MADRTTCDYCGKNVSLIHYEVEHVNGDLFGELGRMPGPHHFAFCNAEHIGLYWALPQAEREARSRAAAGLG